MIKLHKSTSVPHIPHDDEPIWLNSFYIVEILKQKGKNKDGSVVVDIVHTGMEDGCYLVKESPNEIIQMMDADMQGMERYKEQTRMAVKDGL